MKERVSTYSGRKVKIVYDRDRCIHAAECGRGSKDLFNPKNDPWCDPDAVSAAEAVAVVRRCPTGALTIERTDGVELAGAPSENIVQVSPNGPLYLSGPAITIGGAAQPHRVALCRCGHSKNKPYCDNAHQAAGFKDAGPVAADPERDGPADGPLEITPAPDGPLICAGNVKVRSASGRDAYARDKAALCRCGHSAKRPFCDGAHARLGWKSSERYAPGRDEPA